MPVKLQTGFVTKGIQNKRFLKIWMDTHGGSAQDIPINYYLDTRLSTKSTENMNGQGETNAITTMIRLKEQRHVTSRGVLKRGNAKGQSISLEINLDIVDRDITFGNFHIDLIVKEKKRSKKVGV